MTTMTLDQARNHLDDLLARAAAGEKVVIVRDDGSTFSVVPDPVSDNAPSPTPAKRKRGLVGSRRGQIWMAPDFDEIPEGFEPYLSDEPTSSDTAQSAEHSDDVLSPTPLKDRSELFGILKGRVWMAPDFDEIPEGFEPYLGDDVDKTG